MVGSDGGLLLRSQILTPDLSPETSVFVANSSGRALHVQDCEAEEEADVPTKADMWRVVQELALRNSRLEESLEKMRRWVRRQHRKISIIEWLNENCKPSQTYRRWLHSVEVGPRQLNLVFKHGFIAGMTYILQGNLSLSDEHSLPLRSFSRKENVLFGHTDDGWVALGCDDFTIHREPRPSRPPPRLQGLA